MRLPSDDPRLCSRVNFRFTSCTQLLLQIDEAEDFAHLECESYGAPDECTTLIVAQHEHEREHALAACGFSREQYRAELSRRVSSKWAHFCGPKLI